MNSQHQHQYSPLTHVPSTRFHHHFSLSGLFICFLLFTHFWSDLFGSYFSFSLYHFPSHHIVDCCRNTSIFDARYEEHNFSSVLFSSPFLTFAAAAVQQQQHQQQQQQGHRRTVPFAGTILSSFENESLNGPPFSSSSSFLRSHHQSFKASSASKTILFGIIRVPIADSADRLTGLLIAVDRVNKEQRIPGHTIAVEQYYYPHCSDSTCDFSADKITSGLSDFIGNMTRFHAVLYPHFALSGAIIDAGQALGVPIVDPNTVREKDFNASGVFMFEHMIETEISLMIRYMLMTRSCARIGIVYEEGQEARMKTVADAMVFGGYRRPPALLYKAQTTPTADVLDMFFGDPYRKCLFFLVDSFNFQAFTDTVYQDARFKVGDIQCFGWSQISNAAFKITGTNNSQPFRSLHFPKMSPSLSTDMAFTRQYRAASAAWLADATAQQNDAAFFLPSEVPSPVATPSGLMWYLRAMYTTIVYRQVAMGVDVEANISDARAAFIDTADTMQVKVDDYPLFPPFSECRPPPFDTTECSCSVVSRAEYLFTMNGTTGKPISIADRPYLGEKNVGQIALPAESCSYPLSLSSYPFRFLFAMTVGVDQEADDRKTIGTTSSEHLLYGLISGHNLGDPAPVRPYRVITASYPADATTNTSNDAMNDMHQIYEPFLTISSIVPVTQSDSLVLLPNIRTAPFSNKALTKRRGLTMDPADAHEAWNENILQLQPVHADYIHAVAYYYSENTLRAANTPSNGGRQGYTGVKVIARTQEEAALIVASLNTFQIDINVTSSNVMVTADPNTLVQHLTLWTTSASASEFPFIIVSGHNDDTYKARTLQYVASLSASVKVHFGLPSMDSQLETSMGTSGINNDTFATAVGNGETASDGGPLVDIIFGSPMTEYWVPNNLYVQQVRQLIPDGASPTILTANLKLIPLQMVEMLLAFLVATHLTKQATTDTSRTAADLLYSGQTVSAMDVSLGPFYNATCSDEIVRTNQVDRTCQCAKGIRVLRLHSMYNRLRAERSSRTNGLFFHQTTCGVQYKAFERPMTPPATITTDAISTGAIVGIVVGCVAFIIILVGGVLLYLALFAGRDNHTAPKDGSLPFSMVFTDIQSSTTLWSRSPAIMSEAVEKHSTIIRRLIKRHDGYEVKTVGDSFMVAFVDTFKATKFAVDIQQSLFDAQWPEELDEHYREILEAMYAEEYYDADDQMSTAIGNSISGTSASQNSGVLSGGNNGLGGSGVEESADTFTPTKQHDIAYPPNNNHDHNHSGGGAVSGGIPNCPTALLEYDLSWRGIRVRIGVNTGMGEIRRDPTSLGYDYFGTVVNTAARVEGVGHGGQTLITDAVLAELPSNFTQIMGCTQLNLGHQMLRGLDSKVMLIQLLPTELSARRFPALRLEVENVVTDGTTTNDTFTDGSASGELNVEAMATKLTAEFIHKKKGGNKNRQNGRKHPSSFVVSSNPVNYTDEINGFDDNNTINHHNNNLRTAYPFNSTTNNYGVATASNHNAGQQQQQQNEQQSLNYVNSEHNNNTTTLLAVASISDVGGGNNNPAQITITRDSVTSTTLPMSVAPIPPRNNGGGGMQGYESVDSEHQPLSVVYHSSPPRPSSTSAASTTNTINNNNPSNHHMSNNQNNNGILSATASRNNGVAGGRVGGGGGGILRNSYVAGGAAASTSGVGASTTNTVHTNANPNINNNNTNGLSADVSDLLAFSSFATMLFSTSSDSWKKETIKHLCHRWHVPISGAGANKLTTHSQQTQAIMGVSVRAMASLKKSQKQNLQNHHYHRQPSQNTTHQSNNRNTETNIKSAHQSISVVMPFGSNGGATGTGTDSTPENS